MARSQLVYRDYMFGGKWSRCFNVVHTVTPTNNILNFIGQHRERFYDCRYIYNEKCSGVFFFFQGCRVTVCIAHALRSDNTVIHKTSLSHYSHTVHMESRIRQLISLSRPPHPWSMSLCLSLPPPSSLQSVPFVFPIPYAIVSIAVFIDQQMTMAVGVCEYDTARDREIIQVVSYLDE